MRAVPPALTGRFLAAVALAQDVHGEQRRAGTDGEQLLHDAPGEYRAEIRRADEPILESRSGG